MNKLKVMYISNDSGLSGAIQSLKDMIGELSGSIFPVVILPEKGTVEEWLKKENIVYYIIPFRLAYGEIAKGKKIDLDKLFLDNYFAALELVKIIKRENIQLVHSNSIVINVGAIASLITDIPHVWHIREFLEEDFDCELYDKPLKRQLFQCTEAFISISKCVKEAYIQKYRIHSIHIYNGIDVRRYKRDINNCLTSNNIFLLAGGLQSGKGQWDAIKAIEIMVDNGYDNIFLKIIGSGNRRYIWGMEKYIRQKKLEKYIQILPAQGELSDLREKCCFSLTTSKMEALGRVTIEAMLAGNLVIGANTGGTFEIIGEGNQRGYLYKQGDPYDLARTMKKAIEEKAEVRKVLRENAQKYVCDQFNLKIYTERILAVYKKSLEAHKKRDIKLSKKALENMKIRYEQLSDIQNINEKNNINMSNKWKNQFQLVDRWLHLEQNGFSLKTFFVNRNIKRVAIYGMGYLGCDLYDELEDSEIIVEYVIDKEIGDLGDIIRTVTPENKFEPVDAIVVTVLEEEEAIKEYLEKVCSFDIIRLSDIINRYYELV